MLNQILTFPRAITNIDLASYVYFALTLAPLNENDRKAGLAFIDSVSMVKIEAVVGINTD